MSDVVHIENRLLRCGALKPTMTTTEAVAFLGNKKYHRKKIIKPEYIEVLGRSRRGKTKKYFEFSTIKLIAFLKQINYDAIT